MPFTTRCDYMPGARLTQPARGWVGRASRHRRVDEFVDFRIWPPSPSDSARPRAVLPLAIRLAHVGTLNQGTKKICQVIALRLKQKPGVSAGLVALTVFMF